MYLSPLQIFITDVSLYQVVVWCQIRRKRWEPIVSCNFPDALAVYRLGLPLKMDMAIFPSGVDPNLCRTCSTPPKRFG